MTDTQCRLIYGLLIASVVLVLYPIVRSTVRWCRRTFFSGNRIRSSFRKELILFSAMLIGSIWCLRYAVSYYGIVTAPEEQEALTGFEQIFDSLLHALQTFSMDEDYTQYILDGKAMLGDLAGKDSLWVSVYGIYASILNFAAPVAGGAIIFEILASIFPTLVLWLSYGTVWREKYFFSELNEDSLALAKSINSMDRSFLRKPVIIFTDVYVDDEDERASETLMEAKLQRGICIRGDLCHIAKNRFGKKTFFLIDKDETRNLQALIDLSDDYNSRFVKKSTIYLFAQSELYTQVERQVRSRLNGDADFPTIIPVQSYRNLVSNLLVELPLYEPIVGKEREKDGTVSLNVTIFGNGTIGTELFLAVYWFGQMLDCRLTINVVSKDTEEAFWSKINYINPEIKQTTERDHEILKYNDTAFSPPYAEVKYFQSDVKSGEFWQMKSEDAQKLLRTDYFMVALGSDEENISVAGKLRRCIGEAHISQRSKAKTVIAYVVYDPDLCDILNKERCYCSFEKGKPDIYMHAFGSRSEVYSTDNIFMTRHSLWAAEAGDAYLAAQRQNDHIQANQIRSSRDDKDYIYWADLAHAMHLKYKVYSLGWIKTSVFDPVQEGKTPHKEQVREACAQYKRIAIGQTGPQDSKDKVLRMETMKHRLAWLEHRRWSAFTRTRGFRGTDAYSVYYGATGSYKHMSLKLHPCLVECDEYGITDLNLRDGKADITRARDRLDQVTCALYGTYNNYDFKKYDYPEHEFIPYCTVSDAANRLGITESAVVKLCKRGKVSGAVMQAQTGAWMIPVDTLKDWKNGNAQEREILQRIKRGKSDVPAKTH